MTAGSKELIASFLSASKIDVVGSSLGRLNLFLDLLVFSKAV